VGGDNEGIYVVGFPDAETDRLYANVMEATERLSLGEAVTRAEMKDAAKYGIKLFPALVVDGKIVCEGELRSTDDLAKMLVEA
jgi:hypothetical protein